MFRRFSLFDAAPPSSTVSVSRPKPPPVPKLHHSSSSSCAVPNAPLPEFRVPPRTDPINIAGPGNASTDGSLAINGNRTPHLSREGSSTSELHHLSQTTPGHSPGSVGSASSATAIAPPASVSGGIKLLSSSPAYHRQSSIGGSAPANSTTVLQQQLFASIYNQGPNRANNVPVVQAAAAANGHIRSTRAGAARERYSAGRSISSPVSPNQFSECPLSSSMPTSIKYYYTSPTWYSRFSHSLRKNVLRRSTSAHNSQNVMSYIP